MARKEKEKKPQSTKARNINPIIIVIVGFISFLLLMFGVINMVYASTIYPRIYYSQANLAGLNQGEAKIKIETAIKKFQNSKLVIIGSDGKSWTKNISELDFNPDAQALSQNAYQVGRQDRWYESLRDLSSLLIKRNQLNTEKSFSEANVKEFIQLIVSEANVEEKDATLKVENGEISESSEKEGRKINEEKLQKDINANLINLFTNPVELSEEITKPRVYKEGLLKAKKDTEKILKTEINLIYKKDSFSVNKNKISSWLEFSASEERILDGKGYYLKVVISQDNLREYIKNIATQIDQKPVNAKLKIQNGKAQAYSPSQDGLTVEQDKLLTKLTDLIAKGSEENLEIPVKIEKPQVSESEINNLGINELIGEATTSFTRSPTNRIHNITTGASFLNGQLVKPGEIFSTIEALGKIDDTTGYLPELVIKENKTQPEFGGGLCQVSTTLFRAALNAGLDIVERQNHSWRISYYEPPVGLDATIYLPKPDFKFKNDTPGWILVQSSVEGTKITFQLYGTKDGRRSEIVGPSLLYSTPVPETVYVDEPSIPAGETKKIESAHPGGKATATYKVFDKSGKLTNEEIFVSIYKAVPAKYLKGTGSQPAPVENTESQ